MIIELTTPITTRSIRHYEAFACNAIPTSMNCTRMSQSPRLKQHGAAAFNSVVRRRLS